MVLPFERRVPASREMQGALDPGRGGKRGVWWLDWSCLSPRSVKDIWDGVEDSSGIFERCLRAGYNSMDPVWYDLTSMATTSTSLEVSVCLNG